MAEEENGQEKTEDATFKRLEKAREEGQVARSRELGTTLLLMTGGFSVLIFGANLSRQIQSVMLTNFDFDRVSAMDPSRMLTHLSISVEALLAVVGIILFLLMLAGALGAIGLGGWIFSAKPIQPKLSRLNPISGLKRMFSLKSLVELFKATAKFLLVAMVATLILYQMKGDLLSIGQQSIRPAIHHASWIIIWSAIGMSAATVLIALVDVPFQIFDNAQKLKMTRQQVKDEFKDSEGKPEVKSRVRQLQRELAQARMMAAIPDADVIITNPEHFSVALKYDPEGLSAPVVVAKGADQIAIKIREVAVAHQVPIMQSPPLTRAVFYSTEIDEVIPAKLYLAVAQVLAYIYQLRQRPSYRSSPGPIRNSELNRQIEIPEELQFDAAGDLVR